jgi:hypothetical protein
MTDCTLLAKPQPFGEWCYAAVPAGQTIRQMLGDAAYSAHVEIGGYEVPQALWDKVKPKPGAMIRVTLYPQGGRGGKIIKTIAVAIISYYTLGTGSAAAAGWLGVSTSTLAVIGAVSILAINALIPPPSLAAGNGLAAQDPFSQLAKLTGTSNQASPYGVIPCLLGARRWFPPMAALPYTEILGDQQFIRCLLDLGYGDLDISDIEIGGTAIDSYGDVEYEIGTNPSLFTQDVFELTVNTPLNTTGANDTRTTQNPSDEASVDLVFPSGLFAVDAENKTVSGTVDVYVQYRAVGDTTWLNASEADGLSLSSSAIVVKPGSTDFQIKGGARKLLRVGVRWKFPASGQYEVRVGRDTSAWAGSIAQGFQDMTWAIMRSISYTPASTTGTTKLALRVKATGDVSGVVQAVSVYGAQRVRQWDADTQTFTTPEASQNPAWVALWMQTQCEANGNRFADSRMDLDAYAEWAAECATKGYRVSHLADSARPFGDVLRDVFACGRAAFAIRNGKYSVTRDVPQTIPAQTFTAANSWDFSYSRSFLPPPHGLRVKFSNPEANYQEDTFTCYADGYTSANATRFEDLDLRMVDDYEAAWKLARYHIRVMWLRPTQYTRMVDYEHLVCEVGNLTHHQNGLVGWGFATGRVRAVGEVLGPELATDLAGSCTPSGCVETVTPEGWLLLTSADGSSDRGEWRFSGFGGSEIGASYRIVVEVKRGAQGTSQVIQSPASLTGIATTPIAAGDFQTFSFMATATGTSATFRMYAATSGAAGDSLVVKSVSIRKVLAPGADGEVRSLTLDGPVTLESGKTYKLQVRTSENERYDATITNAAGTYTVLTLDTPIPVQAGDLYIVGEVNKGVADLIVRRIERAGDTTAKLTFVDYAPDVLTADAGTPPAFTSAITGQPWCAPPNPPVVHIRFADSAPDDAGVVGSETGVSGYTSSGIHRVPMKENPKSRNPMGMPS